MSRLLSKRGYAVSTALTGGEAIEKMAAKTFQLAIIDINLPDMNGLELHKLITARSPQTKKILLTGLPPEKSEVAGVKEPLTILVKPVPAEELLAIIAEMLK